MLEEEFGKLLLRVQQRNCEEQTLEVKAANKGCPERLYDTFSAFANQNEGGMLLFGLDDTGGASCLVCLGGGGYAVCGGGDSPPGSGRAALLQNSPGPAQGFLHPGRRRG